MKQVSKTKKIAFSIALIFLLAFVVKGSFLTKTIQKVQAKETAAGENDISACDGNFGNLYGYIQTEHLGKIYLSTESWNHDHQDETTDVVFYTNYDRQLGVWSGRGWNEKIGWVDFSYDQMHDIVRFEEPGEDYDNGVKDTWGNWRGEADLSDVVYAVANGEFHGEGIDRDDDTGGGDAADSPVGSGKWFFDHVQFQDSPCEQSVNLFIGGTPYYYQKECPVQKENMVIQWTTENIESGTCQSVAGLWDSTSRPDQNTGTTVHANAQVTEDNSPVLFKLRCTGKYSGTDIEGIAVAACGKNGDPNDPENPFIQLIKPILIEA